MDGKDSKWMDLISKIAGWITGFLAFVSTVVGFIKLWRGDSGLVTIVLLVTGMAAGWLGCLYIRVRKREINRRAGFAVQHENGTSNKELYYSGSQRRLALAGMIIIPVIAFSLAGYSYYGRVKAPDKIIILVADFSGPEPEKYRVTDTILTQLRQAMDSYPDVSVTALGRSISEGEGNDTARAEGQQHKATVVIWGWYGATKEMVPLSVHFEILRSPVNLPRFGPEAGGEVQSIAIAELEGFTLQPRLSAEMAYLSLFTVGVVRHAANDMEGAIKSFTDALSQTDERVEALDRSIVHFYLATSYISKGDYDHAIANYTQAINLRPDFARAYANRGVAYLLTGENDRAVSDFDRTINLQPDLAAVYVNRGVYYGSKGDHDRAIVDFNKVIELVPTFAEAYSNRGLAYRSKQNLSQAIADFDEAIKLRPDFAVAYLERGRTYASKVDYDRAIADYDQAIKLQPDFVGAYVSRGLLYLLQGDNDRALDDFEQAIKLQPDYASTSTEDLKTYANRNEAEHSLAAISYAGRGHVYSSQGNYDRAIADFDQALRILPGFSFAYRGRAIAYSAKGDYDRAIADYTNSIMQGPSSEDFYSRGNAYLAKQDYDLAIADYTQAINLQSDFHAAYFNRGVAFYQKADYENAIQDYTKAIQLKPNDYTAYYNRGRAYNDKGDYDHAISDLDHSIQINGDIASGYSERARAFLGQGDYDRAISDLNQAIKLGPEFAEYYFNRGRVYQIKGDKRRAIADLKKALQLCKHPSECQEYESQLKSLDQGE